MQNTQPSTPNGATRTYIQSTLLGGREVTDQQDLLLSGMIDSLGVMSLVAFLEETYEIQVPFQDVTIENFATIETIIQYAETQSKNSG